MNAAGINVLLDTRSEDAGKAEKYYRKFILLPKTWKYDYKRERIFERCVLQCRFYLLNRSLEKKNKRKETVN